MEVEECKKSRSFDSLRFATVAQDDRLKGCESVGKAGPSTALRFAQDDRFKEWERCMKSGSFDSLPLRKAQGPVAQDDKVYGLEKCGIGE